jgi:hypothetical protein
LVALRRTGFGEDRNPLRERPTTLDGEPAEAALANKSGYTASSVANDDTTIKWKGDRTTYVAPLSFSSSSSNFTPTELDTLVGLSLGPSDRAPTLVPAAEAHTNLADA